MMVVVKWADPLDDEPPEPLRVGDLHLSFTGVVSRWDGTQWVALDNAETPPPTG